MNKKIFKRGIGLVEVVVGAAIVAFVATSIVSAYILHFRIGLDIVSRVQASLLADEGVEVIKLFRDESWNSRILPLSLGSNYYLTPVSNVWESTTTQIISLNKFYRTFNLSQVNRDSNGNIVASGGTTDAGTRKLTVNVSWSSETGTTTKTVSAYINNLYNN